MKRLILILLLCCSVAFAERKLTTNEGTIVLIPLLVDATDGVTPEGAMTVTNITVELMQENDSNTVPTRTAFTPTASGGNNDMALITSSTHGTYSLELTAAQLNFTGYLTVTVIDTDVMCPAMRSFCVTAANVVDAEYGTDKLYVDTVEWDSNTTPVTNAEDFFGNATAYGKFDDYFDGTKVSIDDVYSDALDGPAVGLAVSDHCADINDIVAYVDDITADVNDALIYFYLDHLLRAAVASNSDMTAEVADGSILSNIMSKTSDTSTYTVSTDALENIYDSIEPGAVWDVVLSGHTTSGTTGQKLSHSGKGR